MDGGNFREWFDVNGVSIEELVAGAIDKFGAESVILTGSIANGRGNKLSDIDLLLLGRGVEASLREQGEFDYGLTVEAHHRIENNFEVETYTVVEAEMAAVRSSIEMAVQMLDSPSGRDDNIPVLEATTYRLLDDIRTGVCLHGPKRFESFKQDYHLDHIPNFVLMMALVDHFVTREDIIGQIDENRLDTAMMLTRDAADYLGRAILASCGQANTRPQWRLYLFDTIRSQVGDETIEKLRDYLLRPPHDETGVREYFQEFCVFADAQLVGLFGRCQNLVPAFAQLSQKIQFHISL